MTLLALSVMLLAVLAQAAPAAEAPANLNNQLLTVALNLLLAVGGAGAFWISQRTAKHRTAALIEEQNKTAAKLAEEQVQAARLIALANEAERKRLEDAVHTAYVRAKAEAEILAQQVASDVRHDVRNELASANARAQVAQLEVLRLQRELADAIAANAAKTEIAFSAANDINEKMNRQSVAFGRLHDSFNDILKRQIVVEGERSQEAEEHLEELTETAGRIEQTGEDSNEMLRHMSSEPQTPVIGESQSSVSGDGEGAY